MQAFKQVVAAILKEKMPVVVVSGTVTEVRENELDVSRDGMPELLGVRFHSVIDDGQENKFKVVPKAGSEVLCAIIENNPSEAFLLACSEVDSVQIKIGTLLFELEQNGVRVNNQGQNLKAVLNDFQDAVGNLCDEVNKIVVSIGVSPDVAAITAIKEAVIETNKNSLNKILIE